MMPNPSRPIPLQRAFRILSVADETYESERRMFIRMIGYKGKNENDKVFSLPCFTIFIGQAWVAP